MSQLNGFVWVDPEGVSSVGASYDQHIARYDECLRRLDLLRARYETAWGDDEIGLQFQKQFNQTLDGVEATIRTVRGYLEYAAFGLRISGEGYRQADEDAAAGGRMIAEEFADLPVRLAVGGAAPAEHAQRVPPEPFAGGSVPEEVGSRHELSPTRSTVVLADVRVADPVDDPESAGSPTNFSASRRPAGSSGASPAISAFRRYDTTGVLVDGDPVPPGYELRTLTTFPDGTARVDANGYDSIIPLGNRVPTNADGHPVDSDGDQFFLVKPKEDAVVDPTVPGYSPLLISFDPDGSSTPLFAEPA